MPTRPRRFRPPRFTTPRAGPRQRGYDGHWEKLRRIILERDPVCQLCGLAPAVHVDHKIARARGGSDEESNLQGLCTSCHARKTALVDGGFGRAPVAAPRITGQ